MKFKLLALLFVLLPSIAASAHPHMFFDNRFYFDVEGSTVRGVWIEWEFDDYFSMDMLLSYDWNENGILDDHEVVDLHDSAFAHLSEYNYFIFINQNNRRTGITEISGFDAWMENDTLFYTFYVSLQEFNSGSFAIAVYDPTFFCAISYPEGSTVNIKNKPDSKPDWPLVEDPDNPVYYDPYGGVTESKIYERWEPGLLTFVPEEVVIEP